MMPLRRTTMLCAMAGLLILSGCKKKPKTAPPPQAQAPTISQPATEPQPTPTVPPATRPDENQPAANATPSTTTPTPAEKARKPKTTTRRATPSEKPSPEKDKPAATTGAGATTSKPAEIAKATPPPNPAAPTITQGLPPDAVIHARGTTEQLLQSTDNNLAGIHRTLSTDEKDMVQQIRVYMQQSRGAAQDGDTVRAYNLALRAHLLSDELAKPR